MGQARNIKGETPATAPGRGSSTLSYGPALTTQVRARSVPEAALRRCSKVCLPNCLLDQLVGAFEQCGRHVNAECLCSFQIYHQLNLGRPLHWQICRFLTLEDSIYVGRRTAIILGLVDSIPDLNTHFGQVIEFAGRRGTTPRATAASAQSFRLVRWRWPGWRCLLCARRQGDMRLAEDGRHR